MTTVHMDTELVRNVARQLERTADQIQSEIEQIVRRVRSIPWKSPARENYIEAIEQFRGRAQSTAQQGAILSRRVQMEVDEWEEVAASFGVDNAHAILGASAGDGGVAFVDNHEKPKTMKDLADLIMNGSDPIRSYQIGPNEYLVAIKGTSWDPNASNNWGSAVTTGLGLSSDFQDQVRLALLSLPAGAVVHMAGHSQGGIVAQNLAGHKDVSSHIGIKSITTFGSPYSAPEVGDVSYYRYAAMGDIVTYLEGRDAYAAMLLGPVVGYFPAVTNALINRYPQTTIPGNFSDGVFAPHSEYSKSSALEKTMLFNITAWDGNPIVYDPGTARSGAAVFYRNLVSGFQNAVNTTQSIAGATDGAIRQAGNFFGNLF